MLRTHQTIKYAYNVNPREYYLRCVSRRNLLSHKTRQFIQHLKAESDRCDVDITIFPPTLDLDKCCKTFYGCNSQIFIIS
jgi:hypothetical protein